MLKKLLTSTLLSLVAVGGFFVSVDISDSRYNVNLGSLSSYANTPSSTSSTQTVKIAEKSQDEVIKEMYNKLVAGLNIFLDTLTIIVSPAIIFAGWLMSPDWTSGDLFNLRPTIHKLWIMIANVTYFIYAILLIFIALATIFNSDKYGYKQLLPKLALGIILVPLTWWFVQFIISLSTVVTASVINIPLDTVQAYMDNQPGRASAWWESPIISKEYSYFTDPSDKVKYIGVDCAIDKGKCISPKQVLSGSAGMYSALLVYGNAIFKINELKKLNNSVDAVKSIVGLLNQSLVAIVMLIVFGILVIALVFMLMMRAIKLWFYAMFSPLMTLKYVLGDGIFGSKEGGESFDLKEFIGLAFVPALVGLALSFGIMIVALLQTPDPGTPGYKCDVGIMRNQGCELISIMGDPNNKIIKKITPIKGDDNSVDFNLTEIYIGGMVLNFYGSTIKEPADIAKAVGGVNEQRSVLSVAGGVFGTLIIDFIALIFIWTAFMAAKNVSAVTKAAVAPFEDMGKKIGGFAKTLPKYTPLPLPGGSIAGAQKTIDLGENAFKKNMESRTDSIIGKQFPGLMRGVLTADERGQIDSIIRSGKEGVGQDALNNTLRDLTSVLSKGEKNQINQKDFSDRTGSLVTGRKEEFYNLIKKQGSFTDAEKDLIFKLYTGPITNEYERNKAYELNQKVFGSAKPDSNSTPRTTSATTNGSGTINIRDISFPYNGIDISASPKEIGIKIAEHLNAEKEKFVRPTEDILKKIIEDLGVSAPGGRRDAVLKELTDNIKNTKFKGGT